MQGEEWRRVPGADSEVYVSSSGNVRGSRGPLRAHDNGRSYLRCYVSVNGRYRWLRVHRLVAQAFIPAARPGLQVDHIDGSKHNNAASNLRWVTASENTRHSFVLHPAATRPRGRAAVRQLHPGTQQVAAVHASLTAAAKAVHRTRTSVQQALRNGTCCGGFLWALEQANASLHVPNAAPGLECPVQEGGMPAAPSAA